MADAYDRILVPTDGGELAAAAARRAIGLAETFGATVHALHVVDTSTGWLTVSKDEVRDALRDVGQEASREAFRVVEELAADSDVELVTASLEGSPDDAILDYAEGEAIDLIVMGTHGRSGIERSLIGSVTERVVRGADVPVMTVHSAESN